MVVVVCEDETWDGILDMRCGCGWRGLMFSRFREGATRAHMATTQKFTHPKMHKFGFESLYLVLYKCLFSN